MHVVLAAMAMVMTDASRTQGLGLITEPIINDAGLGIGRADFAWLNLVAEQLVVPSLPCPWAGSWIVCESAGY